MIEMVMANRRNQNMSSGGQRLGMKLCAESILWPVITEHLFMDQLVSVIIHVLISTHKTKVLLYSVEKSASVEMGSGTDVFSLELTSIPIMSHMKKTAIYKYTKYDDLYMYYMLFVVNFVL